MQKNPRTFSLEQTCSATPAPGQAETPVYSSHVLFGTRDSVTIEHGGERYTLRRTRQGKLLLTK